MENTQSEHVSAQGQGLSGKISTDIEVVAYASRSLSAMITLELISSPAEFRRLKSAWEALQGDMADGPNRPFCWLLKAFKYHYLKDNSVELSILVGRHEGQVVMIWPLMKHRPNGISQLKLIEDGSGGNAGLCLKEHPANKDWLMRGYSYLQSEVEWDSLILKPVRKHSLMLTFLKENKALCIEGESGQDFNCLIARNFAGQAYNSLLQGQSTAYSFYKYFRTIYASLM